MITCQHPYEAHDEAQTSGQSHRPPTAMSAQPKTREISKSRVENVEENATYLNKIHGTLRVDS